MAKAYLKPDEVPVVSKVLLQNSFFCHPENIILAGLVDEDINVRRKAVQYILADREQRRGMFPGEVRQFNLPNRINFYATHFTGLIDFDHLPPNYLTEPPLTFKYSKEEIVRFINRTQI